MTTRAELRDEFIDVINARETDGISDERAAALDERYNELSSMIATLDAIANELKIDKGAFEPVDTEGWELEGTVTYKGADYNVLLAYGHPDTYEEQAAMQIIENMGGFEAVCENEEPER